MNIVFATGNKNKIKEIKNLIPKTIKILSLTDIGCDKEIRETGSTISENAIIKSNYIKKNYGYDCFSDDTGLEIDKLDGKPGVFSARYAGKYSNSAKNIELVLKNMKSINDRSAQFRTCISLCLGNENYLFEGIVKGTITSEPRGNKGFGYDSIFKPNLSNKTFAEYTLSEKNKISHRSIALKKLINHLINVNL